MRYYIFHRRAYMCMLEGEIGLYGVKYDADGDPEFGNIRMGYEMLDQQIPTTDEKRLRLVWAAGRRCILWM